MGASPFPSGRVLNTDQINKGFSFYMRQLMVKCSPTLIGRESIIGGMRGAGGSVLCDLAFDQIIGF